MIKMKNVIVVLNYNDYKTTSEFIRQIQDYNSLDKIIVVDNASKDKSYNKLLKFQNNKIDVILNPVNEGYARGNNFGINYANDNYDFENLIISNPDIEVSNETIKKLTEFLENSTSYDCVTGLIYNAKGKVVKNYAWKLPTYMTLVMSSSLLLNKLYSKINPEYMFYKIPTSLHGVKDVEVLPGCFFMIRNEVMHEIGNFDNRTFLYHEENLLFNKLKYRGKSAILLEEKIVHFEGISVSKDLNSYFNKASIMKTSALVYLNNVLKVTQLKKKIFSIVFNIGALEKHFYIKYFKSRM